jgi:hypothetical protein
MTQEQLNKYIELSDTFQNKCELICEHLKPLDWKYGILYKFELDGEWVRGYNPEKFEQSYMEFRATCLTESLSEIDEYVNTELQKRAEEKKHLEEMSKKMYEKSERELYLKLKEKYGNE